MLTKSSYSLIKAFSLYVLCLLGPLFSKAQQSDTILVGDDFELVNLSEYFEINNGLRPNGSGYFYFDFENEVNTIDFKLKNADGIEKQLVLELSNALIDEILFYKSNGELLEKLAHTGINQPISSKPLDHRLFALNIKLLPNEVAAYQLQLKKEKGKPLVTSVFLKSSEVFYRQSSLQMILIGTYYGVSILSVLFTLIVFYILKKYSYLIYALYIVFLGLFIGSYTGLFSQVFLSEEAIFDKFKNYVLFSEISLVLFIIFSQKILEAKTYMPKLKNIIDVLLIVIISIRLIIHFILTDYFSEFISVFVKLWYLVFLIMAVVITIEIFKYFKTNFKRSSLFSLAYIFMIVGVLLTILYHSYGLVNTTFFGLPVVFYSSFLEILFLSLTVALMVKDIYDDRNILSEKLVLEEKKNLYSFIKGEDNERKRISSELHDNIGSKLSYLRRFIDDKFNNSEANEALDSICNDVRNLSHEISPSELNLVGLENAVADLANKLNNQTSIAVNFNSYQFAKTVDENKGLQLYRVIQEILSNIIKHSKAKQVDIQLIGHEDHAVITIEDDGIGFDASAISNGHGLKNISLRVSQIGGTVELDSRLNEGTSAIITFPI